MHLKFVGRFEDVLKDYVLMKGPSVRMSVQVGYYDSLHLSHRHKMDVTVHLQFPQMLMPRTADTMSELVTNEPTGCSVTECIIKQRTGYPVTGGSDSDDSDVD